MLSRSHSGQVGIDTHSKLISQGFQSVDDRIVGRPRLREIRPELAVDGKLLGQFIKWIGVGRVGAGHGESRIGMRDLHARFLPHAKAGVQG